MPNMNKEYALHTATSTADGLRQLFKKLEEILSLDHPLKAYLAGGMATHLYTAHRVTTNVQAQFSGKIFTPRDLLVEIVHEDGSHQAVYLDTSYNPKSTLLHDDCLEDAVPVDLGIAQIQVRVLSPVDLAVSKISRFGDNDKEDIAALARLGLTSAEEIEKRANEAIVGYVGGMHSLRANIKDAVALARQAQQEAEQEYKARMANLSPRSPI